MIKSNIRILRLSQTLNEFSGADEILTLASGGCFESKAILKFVSASKRKHKFRFIKVHNALLNHNYWITLGHNCDVASISSTKSRDSDTMQLDSGWKAFYSGVLSTVYFQRCGGNIRKSQGGSRGGGDRPPKAYESNFIHHDFVQFGKQHSRCKIILGSIVLSQRSCEVHVISLTRNET